MAKIITGKINVFPAGHKDEKGNCGYRDGNGDWHAEFFKMAVGEQDENGVYHSYSWNMDAADCETIANYPLGTTFRVTLSPRFREDDSGKRVEDVTEGKSGVMYHAMNLEDIDVAKEGKIKRARLTKFIADLKAPEDSEEAEGSGDDE